MSKPDHALAALVFHAGALGDHILIWPLLRALAHTRGPTNLTLICDAAKGRLAGRMLGINTLDAEHRRWSRLWHPDAANLSPTDYPAATDIYSFLHSPEDPGAAAWAAAARAATGAAHVHHVGPPGSPSRASLWSTLDAPRLAAVKPRLNPAGPIVLHTGAGGQSKRWPLDRFLTLADLLRAQGHTPHLIAGEVEADRFTRAERHAFTAAGGVMLPTLDALHDTLTSARAFIGADTGPTHLAAQLGLPTLALFGPTDPATWSPVGPRVRVLAPPSPEPMTWLTPGAVLTELSRLLSLAVGCKPDADAQA